MKSICLVGLGFVTGMAVVHYQLVPLAITLWAIFAIESLIHGKSRRMTGGSRS